MKKHTLSDKVRLGLVGCGAWGKNYIETIRSTPGAWLTVVCDPISSNIPNFICHDTEFATDYHDIVDQIDKVIIATPPSTHREIATYFLNAGIPVLLEKPVAETLRDADDIFNTAVQKNTIVLINNIHLFSEAFMRLRDYVKSNAPFHINALNGNNGPFRSYSALLDYGPHDLSMCYGIAQRYPDNVRIQHYKNRYNVELEYGGSVASIVIGNDLARKTRIFEVTQNDLVITYDDVNEYKLKIDENPIKLSNIPSLNNVVATFCKYAKSSGSDWRFDYDMNLGIMKILTSIF